MSGFPLGALISAGGNILSGLFSKQKTKSPAQTIASTVKGAREAGIHPLAALGASPGYSTVSGSNNIGSAVGAGMDALGRSMQAQKSQEELRALKADTMAKEAQAELFRAQSRSIVSRATNAVRGGPDMRNGAPLDFFGWKLPKTSGTSDAQYWGDRYSDIVENFVGTLGFMHDTFREGGRQAPGQLSDFARWVQRNADRMGIPYDKDFVPSGPRKAWSDRGRY